MLWPSWYNHRLLYSVAVPGQTPLQCVDRWQGRNVTDEDLRAVQLSNVMGCLTTYGIGSAPPYFGAGYVPQSKWYQLGLIMSVFYITVWLGVGGAWWKVIGLW